MVLHADDRADPPCGRDLRGRDIAQADMPHQPLALQVGQDAERRLKRAFGRVVHVEHAAQVDDLEYLQTQVAQVVVDRRGELGAREGRYP